ncbi:hypothetical protein BYT27DRAFT_7253277 [Phlegmacium glaucopus]|nr:hypothetical protein BYT27DRAFT_7253277 [Phlegmacium glaucopus]
MSTEAQLAHSTRRLNDAIESREAFSEERLEEYRQLKASSSVLAVDEYQSLEALVKKRRLRTTISVPKRRLRREKKRLGLRSYINKTKK